MRIVSITVKDILPVKRFEVSNLSDVVVLAGPNGIGKTRLIRHFIQALQTRVPNPNVTFIFQATTEEESKQWGKKTISTSDAADAAKLAETLQRKRKRGNWKSSILNFESDRSISNVGNYAATWDVADPYEEDIGWNSSFGLLRDRFQDVVHSLYKIIEHQKQKIATAAIALRKEGRESMPLTFDDPMDPFKNVFFQLLAPKRLLNPSAKRQTLEFSNEGKTFEFSSLSSGEREVVNIAFDFLLRKPHDCITFFDEPELHLHPELSYRLIRTLQNIGGNNQFFLCTHSPDVISASLDNSVIFVSPPKSDPAGLPLNQAIAVTEADETNQALKLLGYSVGIIALGKKIVLIEGKASSLDKQVYGSLIRDQCPGLVLVPSGGKHEIRPFAEVYDKVLSKAVWGVDFFMLCDGDSSPLLPNAKENRGIARRLYQLKRYHLENYFLEEAIWARVFEGMAVEEPWLQSAQGIREKLMEIAKRNASYAAALKVSAELRLKAGNIDVMPADCNEKDTAQLTALCLDRAVIENARITTVLSHKHVEGAVQKAMTELDTSFSEGNEDWKTVIPGRPILHQFANIAKVPIGRAKTLYINTALKHAQNPFHEIIEVLKQFESFQHDETTAASS